MERWIPKYFDALERETEASGRVDNGESLIHTIYFGGGTPSIVPFEYYQRLLQKVANEFNLDRNLEITLEANPGTVQGRDFSGYQQAGINRVSIGVQSFQPQELKLLGRIHNNEDTYRTMESIRAAGINNINLDMIYGIPGQAVDGWGKNLSEALSLTPEHLSLYCLTIEEGTPLADRVARGEVVALAEDEAAEMFEVAIRRLKDAGYHHYEISNWAKKVESGEDYRCQHNLQYWKNEEYYGFGAGAHGYFHGVRVAKNHSIAGYIQDLGGGSGSKYSKDPIPSLTKLEQMQDEMMLGLRLLEAGISQNRFREKFGVEMMEIFGREIAGLLDHQLIKWVDDNEKVLILTERGMMLGNQVFMEFVDGDQ